MGPHQNQFKKKILAASISSCMFTSAGMTVAQDEITEEVIVTGIRESIATSINIKRQANTIVDSITAEGIGKLPDVTISDSLQRISGVQIRRSAGEGSDVNIRGLPQVVTQLNGEQYLGAASVVSTQPNFSDIPSQLFKGADVYKSATANLGPAGISGTINLKTYRPFDFDDGLTTNASLELQRGDETAETDPVVAGLVNWRDDKLGFLLSATYANVNLSNSYNGGNTSNPAEPGDINGWTNRANDFAVLCSIDGIPGLDADSDGELDCPGDPLADFGSTIVTDQGRSYLSYQGISAWNQVTERERLGVNGAFQADLGSGFELTTEWFYTNQEEYNRQVGLSATNKWQHWNWLYPTASSDSGADLDGNDFHFWNVAELSPKRLKSFTQNVSFENTSRNFNLQLDYDNGGPFIGQFRAVHGEANQKKRHGYNEGDLTNGMSTLGRTTNFVPSGECDSETPVGDQGGCFQAINPLGYSENPHITYDTRGEHPTWSGFDRPLTGGLGADATIADYMANLESYNVGAFSSENNEDSDGELDAFSLKGNYKLDLGFITSVDVGARFSDRSADFTRFNLFTPANNTLCEAQWKATDVQLNAAAPNCSVGEMVDGTFEPYIALPHVPLNQYNNVNFYTDFGPVNGIPGVWAIDPHDYDDPIGFMESVFGEGTRQTVPGSSFNVDVQELSYYLQLNFAAGPVSGNFGIRSVETDLNVKQNIASSSSIPYGNTAADVGDILTSRDYRDNLLSLNVAWNVAEDVVARFAYNEAMVPLDLDQYGDGLSLNTVIDSDPSSPTFGQFIVSGGNLTGNPSLDPWRSENLDLSVEWYLGSASLMNVALFEIDVENFTQQDTVIMPQPDADGVIRRSVPINTTVQGEGGTLEGVELGAKIALSDFIDDGILSNFGLDANYTYSPSEGTGEGLDGDTLPFPDNSETQYNFVVWYEADRFQARVAYNYRSERLAATGAGGTSVLHLYQDETQYVDISASYDITDMVSIYIYGSNVTGEFEEYYFENKQQLAFQSFFEPRYTLGVRARF